MRFPGKFVRPASDDSGEGWIIDSDYTVSAKHACTPPAGSPSSRSTSRPKPAGGAGPTGPSGDYDWSISNDTLTLTPRGGADPCGVRGFVWAGQWTRVG